MNFKSRLILILITLILLIGIIIKNFISVEKIDAGNVGIRVNLVGSDRGVDEVIEVTGWVFYMPVVHSIYEFPTYVQNKDYEEFVINTKDGTEFIVDPMFSYRVDRKMATSMFKKFRKSLVELENGFIRMSIYDSYRITANGYNSDSLIANREMFEKKVQTKLSKILLENGFIFEGITSKLEPPKSLKEAIELKNKAKQEAMQAENRLRQEEARAKALIISAEAEKKANDLKTQSLSPLIIQQQFIEKWDGKLPTYGDTPRIFKDINK